MKRKVLFGFMFALFSIALMACDSFLVTSATTTPDSSITTTTSSDTTVSSSGDVATTNHVKTIPVYQGMVVSKDLSLTSLSFHFSGEIDQEDPFGNFDGETIDDEISNLLSLNSFEFADYYVKTNEDFFITVKLHNPDSYEILSFTLNGVKYQSYQFQDGSDSENLILKANSKDVSGTLVFTIDQIKYVDGIEINNAIIEGNQTIKVGVRYDTLPASLISEYDLTPTSLFFNIQIGDVNHLIEQSGSVLKAILYDGTDLISIFDLAVGYNTVMFDKLTPNTLYQYAVVTIYDINDGSGPQIVVLNQEAFYTEEIIAVEASSIRQSSINFNIFINDLADVGAVSSISLYKDSSLVETLTDLDCRTFSNLISDNQYTIEVVYTYDLNNGEGPAQILSNLTFETVAKQTPVLQINTVNPDQDSVSFNLNVTDIDNVGEITSVSLYQGTTLIETATDILVREFSSLLSNNFYIIEVQYDYDLNDGIGIRQAKISYTFSTLAKALPVVLINNVNPDQDSVSFDLNVTDIDNVGEITSVSLYQGTSLIETATDLLVREFTSLLSNNQYTIQVQYDYDLDDGLGTRQITITNAFSTLAKAIPLISFIEINSDKTSIQFELSITDVDNVGNTSSINLIQNGNVVSSLVNLSDRSFLNLTPDRQYFVQVTYQYDLNDGQGVHNIDISNSIYTAPYLGLINTNVINTVKLTEGDTLVLELTVDNPSNMTFTRLLINDKYYTVSAVTTQSKIRVEIVIDSNYSGGLTEFTISKVEGYYHGVLREFDVDANNVGQAFINGDIFVDSIRIVDINGYDIDSIMPGDVFFVQIRFDNPTGYTIDDIDLNYSYDYYNQNLVYTLSENNSLLTIQQTCRYTNTVMYYSLRSFTYSSESVGVKTKNVDNIYANAICVIDTNFRLIYTVQDLKNIQNGYAYKLANDIDLTGIDWNPLNLSYIVLDGNGYSIINFRTVKTYVDASVNIGLFGELNYSTVKNLNFDSVLIMATLNNSTTSSGYSLNVGALVAYSYNSTFENISVSGEMSTTNNTSESINLGGVVGVASRTNFEQIYVNVILSGRDNIGGIAGNLGDQSSLSRTYSSGTIYGNRFLGGLIGQTYSSSIYDSFSSMTISSDNGYYVGGLIGYASYTYILNSYAKNVFASSVQNWANSGILGYGSNNDILNSYSLAKNINNVYIQAFSSCDNCTIENVYSPVSSVDGVIVATGSEIFNIIKGLWDPEVWSFNQEDPALKWKPLVRISDLVITETTIDFSVNSTDFDQVGSLYSISIYNNGTLVETLSDLSDLHFENLKYFTEYTIIAVYVYNYGDSVGDQFVESVVNVTTIAKEGTPTIVFDSPVISQDSITFDFEAVDDENVGTILSISLYDINGNVIEILSSYDSLIFEGLLSDNDYYIKIVYGYDFNDGIGVQEAVYKLFFTTESKSIPEVSLGDIRTDSSSAGYDVIILDPDATGEITAVSLYQGDSLIGTLSNFNSLIFTNVESNTEYRFVVTYTYDLNDGTGLHDIIVEDTLKTAPLVEILATSVLNTEATVVGDTLVLQIDVTNPDNVVFTRVKVNGVYYNVSSSSETKVRVDINITESFGGGLVSVIVEEMIGTINNTSYIYELSSHNESSIFVNGEIYIISFSLVDAAGEDIEYALSGQTYYVKVEFYNPTGYQINSIQINDNTVFSNAFLSNENDQIIVIPYTVNESRYLMKYINSYTYENDSISEKTRQVSGFTDSFSIVLSNVIKEIRTVQDLQSMTNGYYYKLMNDIDLSGISWKPIADFYGVFDGNGHIIKNLTIIKTYEDQQVIAGLFASISGGIIKNLLLVDVNFVITLKTATSNSYSAYVGGLAGSITSYAQVYNVLVTGDISVVNNTNGNTYVGGVAGRVDYSSISRVYSAASVSGKSYVGGAIGYLYYSTLTDSYSSSRVTGTTDYIGGLIGRAYQSMILNVYAESIVTNPNNYWYAYGLVGSLYYSTIFDSFSSSKDMFGNYARAFGDLYNSTAQNTYSLASSETNATFSTLASILLAMEEKWNPELWSFAGSMPVLKRVPIVMVSNPLIGETSISYSISSTDFDGVGSIHSIEVYKDGVLFQNIEDLNSRTIDGLRYDSSYTIKIVYRYDYGDSLGESFVETLYAFSTLEKANTPIVTIEDVIISDSEVVLDYNAIDIEEAGELFSIELYNGANELVASLTDFNQLRFTGLSSYTTYTIKVVYSYDFEDGFGVQYTEASYTFKTNPSFSLTSTSILNTEAIILGDTLVIQLLINNPNNVVFTRVLINDVWYNVNSSTLTKIRIDINVTSTFGGGDTPIEIQRLEGSLNQEPFTFNLSTNNLVNAFINGEIYIVSSSIVDELDNEIEFLTSNQTFYLKVSLYNPTGYVINSISVYDNYLGELTFTSENIRMSEDCSTAWITMSSMRYYEWTSSEYVSITSIVYSNERVDQKSKAVGGQVVFFSLLVDDTIIEVYTVAQLQAMSSGHAYILMNDLDLTGVNFTPIVNFKGYFDGNGHTISNLSIVKTFEDVSAYIGLFASVDGAVVKNLNFLDYSYVINVKSAISINYTAYVGGLVGSIGSYSRFYNINVSGEISVTNQTNGNSYIGGVFGASGNNVKLIDIHSNVNLSVVGNNGDAPIGGIIGILGEYSHLSSSSSIGTIHGMNHIGGLVGSTYHGTIINSYSQLNIHTTSNYYIGGLVGYAPYLYLSNSYASSIIEYLDYTYVGGMVGYIDQGEIANSYSTCTNLTGDYLQSIGISYNTEYIDSYSISYDAYSTQATLESILISVSSVWDHEIWDFDNTDSLGNPTLK